MNHFVYPLLFILLLIVSSACNGGGGGGEEESMTVPRSRQTGMRIVHGSIDETPVDLYVDGKSIQRARFAEPKFYVEVDSGLRQIEVLRANTSLVIKSFLVNLEDETEYSIFLYGGVLNRRQAIEVVTDRTVSSEEGFAGLRIYNALEGLLQVTADARGMDPMTIEFGSVSSFVELPSVVSEITFLRNTGELMRVVSIDFLEKGETSILLAGSESLGVSFTTFYPDLD